MTGSPEQEPLPSGMPAPSTLAECRGLLMLSNLIYRQQGCPSMNSVIGRQINYWRGRAQVEEISLATEATELPVELNDSDIQQMRMLSDARGWVKVLALYEEITVRSGHSLNLNDYGITSERTRAMEEVIERAENKKRQEEQESRKREYERKVERIREELGSTLTNNSHVRQMVEADILQPVSLLETPIRKDNIPPTLLAVIGTIARQGYLEAVEQASETDKPVKLLLREERTELAAGNIIKGYYGTVGSVVGTKLPITPEFLLRYLSEITGHVVPGSVTRLQFDALLTPTGREAFVSRINTVIYQAVNDEGERRIVTTVRKADRLLAELAIQSLLEEAKIARIIIDSTGYEILVGLPSLGKSSH